MPLAYRDFRLRIEDTADGLIVVADEGDSSIGPLPFAIDPRAAADLADHLRGVAGALGVSRRPRRGSSKGLFRSPEEEVVRRFGKQLYDALFPPLIRQGFLDRRRAAQADNEGLRIRLQLAQGKGLQAIPWEFLFDDRLNDFHILQIGSPLVRVPQGADDGVSPPAGPPLRILAMSARPDNWDQLDLEAEELHLRRVMEPLEDAGRVVLRFVRGQTLDDVRRRMNEPEPWHVFHFMGHGGTDEQGKRCLIFCTRDNRADYVTADDFKRVCPGLRLVVLNCCESAAADSTGFGSIAEELARKADAVVAMQYPISDEAAKRFSQIFYEYVVDGNTLDDALVAARQEMARLRSFEWGVPSLHTRTSSTLRLVPTPH